MPKKILTLLLTAAFALALSLPAMAEVKKFSSFSADVPDGWVAEEDTENFTVSFLPADKSAGMTVSVIPAEGESDESIAKQLAEQFNASAPVKQDNGYIFKFKNENGVDSWSLVVVEEDKALICFFFGEHPNFEKIMNSLKE